MPIRGRYSPFNLEAFNARLKHSLLLDMATSPENNTDHDGRYVVRSIDADHFAISSGELQMSANQDTNLHVWQGSFLEQHDFTITESGGTVTGNLEKEGGGDLTMYFSDEFTVLDCTSPQCTVTLTPSAGGGADPVKNLVYILESDKLLANTTGDWPAALHIRVAEVVLRTAAETSADGGALGDRNWNDFAFGITDPRGHGLHITERLRFEHAAWKEGTALSVIGDGTSFIDLKVLTGKVYQLHLQTFPEIDMSAGGDIHVANQPSDPFVTTEDMVADITVDSGNVAFQNNGHFNLVIWGIQNRSGEASHIVCNLPSGSYGPGASSANDATNDIGNFDDFAIPTDFRGTGFLIGRLTFNLSGGDWTLVDALDLRGSIPSNVAGSGIGVNITAFSDDDFEVFAVGDITKKLVFDVSGVTTGNTRTLTVPDTSSTIMTSDAFTPFTGVLTVEGLGTGGQTDYDLKVGDTNGTPTYGMIQIGNACIGRTSFKAGNIDLDGAMIYRNIAGPVTSEIEHVFVESTGDSTRFALPKSAVGNATYNSRSMLIAGPAPADTDYVKVSYWQTNNNIFDNLVCDTAGDGADLGVQNDLEVEGDIFTDSIKESTTNAGVTFGHKIVAPTGSTIGNLTLANGSITDSSGTISFGNEDLITTGQLTVTSSTAQSGIVINGADGQQTKLRLDGSATGTTLTQFLMIAGDNEVADMTFADHGVLQGVGWRYIGAGTNTLAWRAWNDEGGNAQTFMLITQSEAPPGGDGVATIAWAGEHTFNSTVTVNADMKITDGVDVIFGTDSDATLEFDNASSALMLTDENEDTLAFHIDHFLTTTIGDFGDDGAYAQFDNSGNLTFVGAAGFYPRLVRQDAEPANGTGSTQIDDEEMIIWIDTNDSNRVYQMYNDNTNTNIVKVELT